MCQSEDCLALNQDNVTLCVRGKQHASLWNIVSVNTKNSTKHVGLVKSGHHHHPIEM
jgi:hypothetical protein